MRTGVTNDKAMLSFIIRSFMDLSTDNTGQMAHAKCVDQVMYDITNQRKFVVRLCKAARNEAELFSLFSGINIPDFYGMLADDAQFMALKQTCMLQREIQGLKIKIKKKIKKGNKPKKDREYLTKLEKIYKKSIKTFKNLLGIREVKKDAKPKDKYAAIIRFNKHYADNDLYSFLLDDEYDDYDDMSSGYFTADESVMLGNRYRYRNQAQIIDNIDDPNLDDFDDDEEDEIDELRQEMAERFDTMDDKFQKIMSGMGKLISIHEGVSSPTDLTISEEVSYLEEDEDDLRETVNSLTETVNRLVGFVQGILDSQNVPETSDRPRPVQMPTYEPSYVESAEEIAEVTTAMAAMFNDEDEEPQPLRVNGEVIPPAIDPDMSTPEVIDVRNEEVAKNVGNVNDMVDDTVNGKRS